jgi:signal transduction histidine kinase
MSRLLLPFRRLRWQLTLSYILITLVAALTLEVATTVAGVINPPKSPAATPAQILANAMYFTEAPQLVPYLEQTPPDQHGLTTWVNIWARGFTFSKLGFAPRSTSQVPMGSDGAGNVAVVIVGPDGQVVASAPTAAAPIEALLATSRVQATLHTALAGGNARYGPLLQSGATLPDGRTVAAVPVSTYGKGPVLGALLVAATIEPGPKPPALAPFPIDEVAAALKNALPNALALVVLASIVGTLFGVLASRGITRRLGRLTLAADAWSRGELGVEVRDRSRDEVGQLAHGLNSMAEQLQRLLAARQELAVVEERNRLARDLHDAVKQQVFATAMQVAAAQALIERDPAAAKVRLAEAERLAGAAQRELTTLIQELRPAALANKGLAAALRDYCADWSRQSGIAAEVRTQGERDAPFEAEQALFRVAQEALANVARHSGATHAEVWLAWEQSTLMLAIQDDGRGFDAGDMEGKGVGLRSMRERVEALGGALLVASTAAVGTRVEARTPIPARSLPAAVSGTSVRDMIGERTGEGV